MAYSTTTELQNNVKMIEQTFKGEGEADTFSAERIAFADKIVYVDVSRYVDLTSADETTKMINLLSQYKSAEMSLRRITGIKRRQNENDDISEWKFMYDDLLEKIINRKVDVELADGTNIATSVGIFSNTARPNIRPTQGWDKEGEYLNNDDLERVRGNPDDDVYSDALD